MSLLPSVILGFLLSLACGLRVFVPFLCLSIFVKINWIAFPDSWSWISSSETFHILIIATIIEFIAVYFPALSIFYKSATVPVALVSGTFIISFFLLDANIIIEPLLRWTLAIIFGGTISTLFRIFSITIDGGVPHPLKLAEDITAFGASIATIASLAILI